MHDIVGDKGFLVKLAADASPSFFCFQQPSPALRMLIELINSNLVPAAFKISL